MICFTWIPRLNKIGNLLRQMAVGVMKNSLPISLQIHQNQINSPLLSRQSEFIGNYFHGVYTKTHGKNWWKYVPSSVKSSQFKRKIEEWKKKGVKGLDQPSLKYWDAMTTSALHECITTNKMWPKFKVVLNVSSSNFNTNWGIFSDLRNTFAHSNDAICQDNHLDQGISTSKIL